MYANKYSSFSETNQPSLNCRTEKDRTIRLNHRTAGICTSLNTLRFNYIYEHTGILAGMWPCGVITFIRELFVAESKSQVYGHVHQFLQDNHETALHLSTFIVEYIN